MGERLKLFLDILTYFERSLQFQFGHCGRAARRHREQNPLEIQIGRNVGKVFNKVIVGVNPESNIWFSLSMKEGEL